MAARWESNACSRLASSGGMSGYNRRKASAMTKKDISMALS
jgi:hypothetical protein